MNKPNKLFIFFNSSINYLSLIILIEISDVIFCSRLNVKKN